MRALVAMMADIDLEAVRERREIDLVGAEQEEQLRRLLGQRRHAARLGVAEHQPAGARGGGVEDVVAVPAVPDEIEGLDQREGRRLPARHLQRAAADDHRRTLAPSSASAAALGRSASSDRSSPSHSTG